MAAVSCLSELLQHKLVRRFLRFDVTFHGEIVAEALGGTTPARFFERGGVAVASTNSTALVFLQRELHGWVTKQEVKEYLTHRQVDFCLEDSDGVPMRLRLYCWKAAAGSGMTPRLDIDLLLITRSGVSVAGGDFTNNIPVPLDYFTRRCLRRVYSVLPDTLPDDKALMPRLRQLGQSGWAQQNSAVKFTHVEADAQADACPICHDPLSAAGLHSIVTACDHQFHESCWKKHVDHSMTRAQAEGPPEPLLRSPFQFGLRSLGHAIYISCPMCRHSMRCIQTIPS